MEFGPFPALDKIHLGSPDCAAIHSPVSHTHCWAFTDYNDAVGVAKFKDLLRIRVVAGAKGIGPQPAQEVEIFDNQGPVQPFATDLSRRRIQ